MAKHFIETPTGKACTFTGRNILEPFYKCYLVLDAMYRCPERYIYQRDYASKINDLLAEEHRDDNWCQRAALVAIQTQIFLDERPQFDDEGLLDLLRGVIEVNRRFPQNVFFDNGLSNVSRCTSPSSSIGSGSDNVVCQTTEACAAIST